MEPEVMVSLCRLLILCHLEDRLLVVYQRQYVMYHPIEENRSRIILPASSLKSLNSVQIALEHGQIAPV